MEFEHECIDTIKFLIKNPLKIGNLHLALMADEGHKGQNLVLAT